MRRLLCAALLSAALLTGAGPAAAAGDSKIGVVNMERVLRDALVAKEASDRLNAEAQRRQEEVDALARRFKQRLERFEKDAKSMDESARVVEQRTLAEMERDINRRNREARDEFNQRRNEEVFVLQGRAARVIQEIAHREGYDLVLNEFFFASHRIDLTDRVIEALDREFSSTKKKK